MKKVITAIIFVGLFYSSIFAQEAEEKKEEVDLSGKFALMFQVGSNFSLRTFEGSTISAKYQISNVSSVRFSLSTNFFGDDTKQDAIRADTLYSKLDEERNFSNLDLSIYYLQKLRSFDDIGFYVGVGPFVRLKNTFTKLNETQPEMQFEGTDINNSYGVSFIVGVEWFVKKNISFLAEYSSSYFYSTSQDYQPSTSYTYSWNTKSSEWAFSSNGAKIGLSLYF
ncbi:MAG: hypothetical protein SCALA702_03910 [Melioribacteraceae bacterium]|nr:MAG: hypothetical protein SCALA702_03910 [Melioribacteraceae bacterium]